MLGKFKGLTKQKKSKEEERMETLASIDATKKAVIGLTKIANELEVEKAYVDAGLEKMSLVERGGLNATLGLMKAVIWIADAGVEYMEASVNSEW